MPDFVLEDEARRQGHAVVAGVDEAGRGPLAGPVVAAAVILDPETLSPALRHGLDDSKKLSAAVREALFQALTFEAVVGVGEADVEEIDTFNILEATLRAMTRAVKALGRRPDLALIDGNRAPILDCRARCVIKGDAKSLSIAAASVVAKVTRDRAMAELAKRHPGYGWERNAGYGTAEHLDALARLGVTPAHRRSYAPVRNMLRSGLR